MQIGMVGLGRMGANMVRRLSAGGHRCVGCDSRESVAAALAEELGMLATTDLSELVAALDAPRHVWLMVPAAAVDSVVEQLATLLEPGDTIVDGGNSWYGDDIDRAHVLSAHGIDYLDVGTSGGVHGRERGYCLMIGGPDPAVARLVPVFDTLAPGVGAAERTPSLVTRHPEPAASERGWLHCGPHGAGHFVKMVHNGIEYGMMAALAEGLNVLDKADAGNQTRAVDAETAPLADPEHYRFEFDLAAIAEVWRRGSVVSSWLLDVTAAALAADPQLDRYAGRVADSGEGRWALKAAVDEGVPVPVLSAALFQRFTSRDRADVANRLLSAMRDGFGGHAEGR